MSLKDTFTEIYEENTWKSKESRSGQGSTLDATSAIRWVLPNIFQSYGIVSVLDIPCGDYAWWPEMNVSLGQDMPRYVGADIVPEIIAENLKKYQDVDFRVLDIVNDELPQVDLIFCRDCLGHLSNENVEKALKNIKRSGAKYLMATTYYDPRWLIDADIPDGAWRPINMIKQFGMGNPILMINENFTKNMDFNDKSLALWKL